jgi:hypothetical protein
VPVAVLSGTVRMSYQGAEYNIPVRLVLPYTYPRHPPHCYATPQGGLSLRVDDPAYVAPNGRLTTNYLRWWSSNPGVRRRYARFVLACMLRSLTISHTIRARIYMYVRVCVCACVSGRQPVRSGA